jgi:perosamine synthetase
VAVPTYACSALLNAISMSGAAARPVDVRRDDYTIDPSSVARLASDARAAIAVHTYGACADVAALKRMGLAVIEDCCQSLGGPQGRLGDAAVFSFYATKVVTGGQGGLVWSADGTVAEWARDYVHCDCRPEWKPRFNLQLTDLQAALVLAQLDRLDQIKARRRAVHDAVRAALPAGLSLQSGLENRDLLPYRCVVEASASDRDRLRQHCTAAGVATIVPVERYELLHRYLGIAPADYPAAEEIVNVTLSLPCYPALSERDRQAVVDAVGRFP